MEDIKDTKKKLRNYAFVEGYLRENYLKEGKTNTGKDYISGDVIVSVNRYNSQRVHVFAFATKYDGTKNKAYESLKAVLPSAQPQTIASYVNSLPDDGSDLELLDEKVWDAATKVAAKVWFSGSLEEYATISVGDDKKERETSTFSFRASNGGIRRDNDKREFSPRDNVEMDGSILSVKAEQKRGDNDDLVETGRMIVDYLYIDYKGIGHKFKLYAGTDKINPKDKNSASFAEFVSDNYEAGQTAKFNIAIVNLAEKKALEPKNVAWGQTSEPTVVTNFVHELRIIGGRTLSGLSDGDDGFIPKDEVTDAGTKRRINAKENWERSQARKNAAPVKAETKGFGISLSADPIDVVAQQNFTVPDFSDF